MERLTERSAGVAVIKDKIRQKDVMEALARYEETGLTPEEIMDGKMLTGWIPVEDRLPEESLNSVIGWDEYRKRCCFVQYYCGRWILGNDVDSVKITAWQPLPEPYRPDPCHGCFGAANNDCGNCENGGGSSE